MSTDPSKHSQVQKILSYLESGNSITPITALKRFKCMRLASRINDIRNLGVTVKTEIIKNQNGKRYAQYRIENDERTNSDILEGERVTDLRNSRSRQSG